MIDYVNRKLEYLKEDYDKDEFLVLLSLILQNRESESQETLEKIGQAFNEFITYMKDKLSEEEIDYLVKQGQQQSTMPSKKVSSATTKTFGKEDRHYKDTNDNNQLQWGGTRSSSHLFDHPMRSAPMFFRRNGNPIDLINMYQGGSVFLINNGPSFKDVDKDKLKQPGIITYGINNGAQVFRPNIWSCVDDPTRFMESIWKDPTILKLVPQSHMEKPYWDLKIGARSGTLVGDCPNVAGFRRNERFDAEQWLFEDTVNWGNHKDFGGGRSILVATLRICFLLGFKNVYLLGCDFEMTEDSKYWFEEQRTEGAIKNNNNSYKLMIEYFEQLKPKFDEIGFNVYNLNPDSKLKVFPFKDFDECIDKETIDTSASTHGMYIKRK